MSEVSYSVRRLVYSGVLSNVVPEHDAESKGLWRLEVGDIGDDEMIRTNSNLIDVKKRIVGRVVMTTDN